MDTRRCSRCETTKPLADFQPNRAQKSGVQTYCRDCSRVYRNTAKYKAAAKQSQAGWYEKNAEVVLAQKKAEYLANLEVRRAKARKANRDPAEYARHAARVVERSKLIKAQVFDHYGLTCACCGEANMGFLTIDHMNGCGKETRKEHGLGWTFYIWLRKNGFPEGFQTLCYNCNQGRAKNGGICPHKA